MNITDSYFADKIERWAKSARGERATQLATGMASDYADYRNRVGYLTALDDLLNQMQVTEREMSPERQESAA